MSDSDKSTVDLEGVKKKFDDAIAAINTVREAQDNLEKRVDGVEQEKLQKATDDALKALDEAQKSQQLYVGQNATIEAQEKRIEDLEKWLAKGGGNGDQKGRRVPEYAKGFNGYVRKRSGSVDQEAADANILEMCKLWLGQDADEDTVAKAAERVGKTLVTGSLPDGGFWVPVDRQETMITRIFETSPMRQLVTGTTTGTSEVVFPIDDQEMTAVWENELSPPTTVDTPQTGELRIPVHNLGARVPITENMLEDATRDVVGWITMKATDKFARTENTAFVIGDGVGKPKGFLSYDEAADPDVYERNAIGIIDVANETAAGFEADDFIEVQNHLKEPFQAGAVWVMKRRTFASVLKLKDQNDQYLLRFGDMLATGAGKQVLGSPVIFMDDMPAPADSATPIAYGNFRAGYTIVDRIGVSVLIDPYTQVPKVLYRFRKRLGGAVTNWDAIKLMRSNVT